MFFPHRYQARALLVTAMLLASSSAWAQAPEPPPPAQEPAPPPSDVPEPVPPPEDDGPKPAGVGTSQPPAADGETPPQPETSDLLPEPASFPGVPLSGTARSSRPFTGLFAGAAPVSRNKHSLVLSGSLFAAYSTNVAPRLEDGQTDPRVGQASTLAGGSATLAYNRNWSAGGIGAHVNAGRSWVEAYRDTRDPWISRWDAGVNGGYSKQLARRVRFGVSGSAGYSPYVQFSSFDFSGANNIVNLPTEVPGLDRVLARDPSVLASAAASLSYAISQKASIETYYSGTFQEFVGADPINFDRRDQAVGARYRYRFARFLGVRAGYGYRRGDVDGPDAQPFTSHFIDAGVDAGYGRSYALTRRTTFSFSTDSSLFLNANPSPAPNETFDSSTRVFFGGTADLVHTMGRSWVARTGYRRGVSYELGFNRPVLTDTAIGNLSGLLTSRLDFNASASYTSGQVGFSGAENGFGAATTIASLRYALTRRLAAYAQYFYYHYLFDQGVALPSFLGRQLDRQGVSVGLTATVPLIGSRGRR